jgi:hypothetical protein
MFVSILFSVLTCVLIYLVKNADKKNRLLVENAKIKAAAEGKDFNQI